MKDMIDKLNQGSAEDRLAALKAMTLENESMTQANDPSSPYVNNHIHTTYSFSPYSPTKAVWMAKESGLATAGIIDHDSISGAREFIEAGKLLNMPTTIGIECRVSMATTNFKNSRLNNTDQKGIAYVAMHGIPHSHIDDIKEFLKPYLEKRMSRNRLMVDKINALFPDKILDFDLDVISLSEFKDGGSVTERHLLYALSLKLVERLGKGQALVSYLEKDFDLEINGNALDQLLDQDNPHYTYDLLGLLKGHLVSQFYIDATEECPPVEAFIAKSHEVGAIAAYAYLGDVVNSVTGDKKDARFEDSYLDDLFDVLKGLGFDAITYMPSRNTKEQLKRVRDLCDHHGFFQISGEDINSPRQSFICAALQEPEYENLITSTWALIGHERRATEDITQAMFSPKSMEEIPYLNDRINHYVSIVK